MKTGFKGKAIYNPSGKAGEYSQWAVNFYNGCSARCEYCYNRHGRGAEIMGGDIPTLKKSLLTHANAIGVFNKELMLNANEIRKHGLFFNFVSDPCLKETFELNFRAWFTCDQIDIPVKILTKQTWWVDTFLMRTKFFNFDLFSIGFTLTGHDELEPGAASNQERIETMKKLHEAGFKTWASIEPIIDFESSAKMIKETKGYCDLYKIGLQSGKKYNAFDAETFYCDIMALLYQGSKVYWKDSFLKLVEISRESLPDNCVTRDFNL